MITSSNHPCPICQGVGTVSKKVIVGTNYEPKLVPYTVTNYVTRKGPIDYEIYDSISNIQRSVCEYGDITESVETTEYKEVIEKINTYGDKYFICSFCNGEKFISLERAIAYKKNEKLKNRISIFISIIFWAIVGFWAIWGIIFLFFGIAMFT